MNPNPDERAGMAWWNNLSLAARAFWLTQAGRDAYDDSGAACIADAWRMFKLAHCAQTGVPLRHCTCAGHMLKVVVPA
jgi:hypothetical protein